MLSTTIVIFREALEIAIILGIVLAATRGVPNRMRWIGLGFVLGTAGAALVAVFAESISASMEGMGQELFNAGILFTAALFIGWTVVWMQKHAREMGQQLKQVGHDVTAGTLPRYSLSFIIGLAMLREGAEIVLFTYGMILSGQSLASIASGSAAGLVLGIAAGILFYYGLLKIPAKYALKVTSWLLILLVAGLASQAVNFLSQAGYFESLSYTVWDTSWLLSDSGPVGGTLHVLVGYTAEPTAAQLIAYMAALAILVGCIRLPALRASTPATV